MPHETSTTKIDADVDASDIVECLILLTPKTRHKTSKEIRSAAASNRGSCRLPTFHKLRGSLLHTPAAAGPVRCWIIGRSWLCQGHLVAHFECSSAVCETGMHLHRGRRFTHAFFCSRHNAHLLWQLSAALAFTASEPGNLLIFSTPVYVRYSLTGQANAAQLTATLWPLAANMCARQR